VSSWANVSGLTFAWYCGDCAEGSEVYADRFTGGEYDTFEEAELAARWDAHDHNVEYHEAPDNQAPWWPRPEKVKTID
jgi:hypothetical protein